MTRNTARPEDKSQISGLRTHNTSLHVRVWVIRKNGQIVVILIDRCMDSLLLAQMSFGEHALILL